MSNKIYINGISSISAQPQEVFLGVDPVEYSTNIIPAISPDYKAFIPARSLRRMSKVVKMGISAARTALLDASVPMPNAIITGTGEGCKQDTELFLEALLRQEEALLSPTAFIQSTHNTVGGQIALYLKCTGYNSTYSQVSASVEAALIDGMMQFLEHPEYKSVLVGGVDEVSKTISSFLYLDKQLKQEEVSNLQLFKEHSEGSITSEGAHFFSLSSERSSSTYATLQAVTVFQASNAEAVEAEMIQFLVDNEMPVAKLDLVILGNNGDSRFDYFYAHLQEEVLNETAQIAYKHLVGDYNTVSGYALWLACSIFRMGKTSSIFKLNKKEVQSPKSILIYNQYLGRDHSFILLKSI
ncbi:beta-ketoacyl synthase chain length factor [Gillisia sp. M10.2A]|uniref:Beta-ketoacyl synthase chain length factor n=1 Tax=Gillisia lutea TaxID=2909668 RepID=A0ABS9EFL7_9FLAO|nr:beta-ketoacyl synthase chain length factor [Gillisia lutea]MCF4101636.1 beta-ketoacyl synthase chain length factor [Gillisia lutea]